MNRGSRAQHVLHAPANKSVLLFDALPYKHARHTWFVQLFNFSRPRKYVELRNKMRTLARLYRGVGQSLGNHAYPVRKSIAPGARFGPRGHGTSWQRQTGAGAQQTVPNESYLVKREPISRASPL